MEDTDTCPAKVVSCPTHGHVMMWCHRFRQSFITYAANDAEEEKSDQLLGASMESRDGNFVVSW